MPSATKEIYHERKAVASLILPRTFIWCATENSRGSYGSGQQKRLTEDSEWFILLLDLGRQSSVWLGKEVATQNLLTKQQIKY